MPNYYLKTTTAQVLNRVSPVKTLRVVESQKVILTSTKQGPPGPPGPAGSIQHTAIAATALGGHRVILIGSSGATYADSSIESHAGRVAGITLGAVSIGETVSFQSSGRITEASWSWTPDGDIWLGSNGLLTQVYPTGAAFSQLVGYAINATSIWVELSDPTIH